MFSCRESKHLHSLSIGILSLKNLVIVESPAKCKPVEKYLGSDFKALSSYGHIRDLPSKDGSVDVENDFEMHYQVSSDKEKQIRAIVAEAKKCDRIYLASDLDREGEAISWHVLEELKARIKGFDESKVKRIVFTEITKKGLQEAIANPKDLDMDMVNAQQARRALDYLVGFNLSPVLWRKVKGGLSAGRVQSVALRLICEREEEIENFKPEEYWSIEGQFQTPRNDQFKAKLTHLAGDKLEKFTINTEELAKNAVENLKQGNYSITDIVRKQTKRNPSAPFITSTLQIEASRKLGFGAKRTMQAAQKLYEAGFITYMRTDSVNLSGDAISMLRDTIENKYGSNYVPEKPVFYKSKTQNAQEAHEAIRPTQGARLPSEITIGEDEKKLYKLIWQRTIACQMAPAKLDQTALVIEDQNKNAFRATGSIVTFDGFMKVYQEHKSDEDSGNEKDRLLPQVDKDELMDLLDVLPDQHFTEPPARYSEATLVKVLEDNGIGRPSTYASIVTTIQDRGYVRLDKRRFFPEDVGRIVNKFLTQHFTTYVDYNFTANMEEELDAVSRGEKEWKPMLSTFWSPFKSTVDDKMENVKKSDVTTEKTGEKCPTCGEGELLIRLGRYGRFKGCNRYPECKHIENLVDEHAGEAQAQERAEPKDTGVQCPKCKENNIFEKTSRRGKVFYGCGGYPKCQNAYWDKPIADTPCPSCGHPFILEKETKRDGLVRKCPNEDCDWQDPPMTEEQKKRAAAAKERAAKKKAATASKKKAATTKKKSATTRKKKAATAKKKAATASKKD